MATPDVKYVGQLEPGERVRQHRIHDQHGTYTREGVFLGWHESDQHARVRWDGERAVDIERSDSLEAV